MSFYVCVCFGIIALSAGVIFGSIFSIVISKVFRKRILKAYFSVICVFLSLVISSCVVCFFISGENNFNSLLKTVNTFFVVFLFLSGFICSVFWKIAIPLLLTFYIILSVISGVKLYGEFGSKTESATVTLNKNLITLDSKNFSIDKINGKALVVEVYTLPSILLLPLPRVWFSVIGVVDSALYNETISDIRGFAGFSGDSGLSGRTDSEKKHNGSNFWLKTKDKYFNWMLNNKKYLLIQIPVDDMLPAVYTLNFTQKGEVLTCRLIKNL